jgi:hypothetical protein
MRIIGFIKPPLIFNYGGAQIECQSDSPRKDAVRPSSATFTAFIVHYAGLDVPNLRSEQIRKNASRKNLKEVMLTYRQRRINKILRWKKTKT